MNARSLALPALFGALLFFLASLAVTGTTWGGMITRLQTHAGTSAGEIISGAYDIRSSSGERNASAIAVANGTGSVTVSSVMSIPSCNGYDVVLNFDCSRAITAGARPSNGFNIVGTTNAFWVTVTCPEAFTLDTSWSATCSGYVFGMPYVDLYEDSTYLAELFDSWTHRPAPSGSRSDSRPKKAGERRFRVLLTGTASASTGLPSNRTDRVTGNVTLRFKFPPQVAPIMGTSATEGGICISLGPSSYGQTNTMQFSSDLGPTGWSNVLGVVSTGSGTNVTLAVDGKAGFYRCKMTVP